MPQTNEDLRPEKLTPVTIYVDLNADEPHPFPSGGSLRKQAERHRKKESGLKRCEAYLSLEGAEFISTFNAVDRRMRFLRDTTDRKLDEILPDLEGGVRRYVASFAVTGHDKSATPKTNYLATANVTGHATGRATERSNQCIEKAGDEVEKNSEPKMPDQRIQAIVTGELPWPESLLWCGEAYSRLSGWRESLVSTVIKPGLKHTPDDFPSEWRPSVKRGLVICGLPFVRRSFVFLLLRVL